MPRKAARLGRKLLLLGLVSYSAAAQAVLELDFRKDALGSEPSALACAVGNWIVERDEGRVVLRVDGSHWDKGASSPVLPDIAKALYGAHYAEFLDAVKSYAFFPFAVIRDLPRFQEGELSFRFKPLAGRIDQGAGFAFDIKPNGDYLILRANALESNFVLFQYKKGKRSPLKWVRGTPTPTGLWHNLRLRIKGRKVLGFLNGQGLLDYDLPAPVDGRIGLWSKADSVVLFDKVSIQVDR